MDVKSLITQFDESTIRFLSLTQGTDQLILSKDPYQGPSESNGNGGHDQVAVTHATDSSPKEPTEVISTTASPNKEVDSDDSQFTAVKAPLVGIVYLAPNPGAESFVSVGSVVKKGQVVCIIEAMKIMNEVVAPVSGTIKKINVTNEEVVEYDQPLVVIDEEEI